MGARATLIAAPALIGLGLCLSACDYFPPDPVSLTMRGGEVIVRICQAMPSSHVALKKLPNETGGGYEDYWVAEGSGDWLAGTELSLGTVPMGYELTVGPEPFVLEPGEYNFEIYDLTGVQTYAVDAFFDTSDLAEGIWLDGYGEVVELPCVPEECPPAPTACIGPWEPEPGMQIREATPAPTP